jgi:Helix-turn-helix domain/HRDC domain
LNAPNSPPLRLRPPASMVKYLKRKKPQYLYEETTQAGKPRPVGTPAMTSSPQQVANFNLPKNVAQDLLKLLLRKRSELSTSLDVMPYMIASNLALTQLATRRPLNLDEMRALKIDGFSEVKIIKFGPAFLQCIQQKLNFLPATSSQEEKTETLEDLLQKHPFGGAKGGARKELAYSKFKGGFAVETIANEMMVQPSTVTAYLVDLMKCGFKFTRADLRRLGVSDQLFVAIRAALPDLRTENCVRLTEVKQQLPEEVTFDQVKFVAGWFQIRQHARDLDIPFHDEEASPEGEPPLVAVKSETSVYFTPAETETVAMQTEVPVKTEPENLWDDENDSMDFDMDQVMNALESNRQAQLPPEPAGASQCFAETSNLPTTTLPQPKILTAGISKPNLGKLKATKRVIYEQTSSDDEASGAAKKEDVPVKRALPSWMGKGVASSPEVPKPPSRFQFKQKKTMF